MQEIYLLKFLDIKMGYYELICIQKRHHKIKINTNRHFLNVYDKLCEYSSLVKLKFCPHIY